MQENSTSRLARALSTERTLTRQAAVLAALVAVCAVARLSPYHEPEPMTGALILIATLVLASELVWAWATHSDITFLADELILQGLTGERHRSPIDRALSDRIASIENFRARHRLANDLRWRVRLAEGTTRPSAGYIRACAFPPLGTVARQVFLEEEAVILEIVDRIELSPVDPRALVMLWRVVASPPPPEPPVGGAPHTVGDPAEELRECLRRACVLAKTESGTTVAPVDVAGPR